MIIDLQPAYLDSLAVGKYKLTALFDDGSATAEFTVLAKEEEKPTEEPTHNDQPVDDDKKSEPETKPATKPEKEEQKPTAGKKSADTGDTGNNWIWGTIVSAAVAGITATVMFSRKRRDM